MSNRKAIGIVSPQLSGVYFSTLLASIHAVTRRYDPRLIAVQGVPADIARSRLACDQVDGWLVINTAEGLDRIVQLGAPIVTIGVSLPTPNCPAVFPDNHGGMYALVRHLIDHGHRHIAFVGDLANYDVQQRYAGYLAALADQDLPHDQRLLLDTLDNSDQQRTLWLQHLFSTQIPCTAIVGATDQIALNMQDIAQMSGYRVPEDLAVVGFDDIVLASSARPPLTTVKLPIQALGSTAAQLLIDWIGGMPAPQGVTYVPTTLILRQSCGCQVTKLASFTTIVQPTHNWQEFLAQQLVQLIRYPLVDDPLPLLEQVWPGGMVFIDLIAATAQGADDLNLITLHEAWGQALELTDNIEVLLTILEKLREASQQQVAALPNDHPLRRRMVNLLAQINMALIQMRLAPQTAFILSFNSLVQRLFEISKTLLSGSAGTAAQLTWLQQTPMSWGCLALWNDSHRGEQSTLVVAGSYQLVHSLDAARFSVGHRCTTSAFPPTEMLPNSVTQRGTDIVMLMPVQSTTHDWGILALAGAIDYLRASGSYDVLTALATLLGETLERDQLHQTLLAAHEREQALDKTIHEIGSPVIPLLPGVLLVPLVGTIDQRRSQHIMTMILQGVSEQQAEVVLLDITGVSLVDTQVANVLIQAARAASLLGTRVVLVGVRPEIAQSIVGLGVDLGHITTQATLAVALQALLNK